MEIFNMAKCQVEISAPGHPRSLDVSAGDCGTGLPVQFKIADAEGSVAPQMVLV